MYSYLYIKELINFKLSKLLLLYSYDHYQKIVRIELPPWEWNQEFLQLEIVLQKKNANLLSLFSSKVTI